MAFVVSFNTKITCQPKLRRKCEILEEASQGASDWGYKTIRVLKRCLSKALASGSVGVRGLWAPHSPMKCSIVEIQPLAASYKTQEKFACHQHLVSERFVSTFILRFEPTVTCLYLRFSVSYTKIKLGQVITYDRRRFHKSWNLNRHKFWDAHRHAV